MGLSPEQQAVIERAKDVLRQMPFELLSELLAIIEDQRKEIEMEILRRHYRIAEWQDHLKERHGIVCNFGLDPLPTDDQE